MTGQFDGIYVSISGFPIGVLAVVGIVVGVALFKFKRNRKYSLYKTVPAGLRRLIVHNFCNISNVTKCIN